MDYYFYQVSSRAVLLNSRTYLALRFVKWDTTFLYFLFLNCCIVVKIALYYYVKILKMGKNPPLLAALDG